MNRPYPKQPQNNSQLDQLNSELNKLSSFFEDKEQKIINADLLSGTAEKFAEEFANLRQNLTINQVRKFYNEFIALDKQVDQDFERAYPVIKMTKSKAAYAAGRSSGKIPREFKDFLYHIIDKIKTKEDFKAAKRFYEAMIGYFTFYGK